jgi:surface protein
MKPITEYVKQASNFHFPRVVNEYLSTKVVKPTIIKATDETIKKIVKDELDRLGHDADLNHIDVSKVTNMNSLFSCYKDDLGKKYKDLNPDISKWDVSNAENMQYMFYGNENFNKDISGWDVSKVENMEWMFYFCEKFDCDISGWDVKKVKYKDFMFYGCNIKEEFKPKFN